MTVEVHRGRDGLAAGPAGDLRDGHTPGQRDAGERVSLVKGGVSGETARRDGTLPDVAVVIIAAQRRSRWRAAEDRVSAQPGLVECRLGSKMPKSRAKMAAL